MDTSHLDKAVVRAEGGVGKTDFKNLRLCFETPKSPGAGGGVLRRFSAQNKQGIL